MALFFCLCCLFFFYRLSQFQKRPALHIGKAGLFMWADVDLLLNNLFSDDASF